MTRAGVKPGKDFWLAALRHEGAAFRAAVSEEAFPAAVPSCPGWTVRDLVGHLGALYQRVRGHITRGVTTRPEQAEDPVLPEGAELLSWWDQQFEELTGVLDQIDPELPAWNWAPQAKKAVFWHRRMAHETAIRRWDAQVASGLTEPIETKLAVDGVAEVLDTWLPAGKRRSQPQAVGLVQLHASDIEHSWLVRVRREGIALLDTSTVMHEEHAVKARASGTVSDLLLALYGRVPFEVLDLSGDVRLLEALRTG